MATEGECAAGAWGRDEHSNGPDGDALGFPRDTSFGENYQEGLAGAGGTNVLEELGYDHMLASFEAVLRGASLVVANLETPVTDLGSSPLRGRKRYIHHADVEETPRHLAGYGIDLVSLANNHAMDYGLAGHADTTASLTRRDIATCGAGRDAVRAGQPYRHDVRLGDTLVRIAVICAFEYSEVHDQDLGFYAGAHTAGVNPLVASEVAVQVEALRREDATVFVVAFPHWGGDYRQITPNQRAWGERWSTQGSTWSSAMARICCKGWSGTGPMDRLRDRQLRVRLAWSICVVRSSPVATTPAPSVIAGHHAICRNRQKT